jgi:hypothetical protein
MVQYIDYNQSPQTTSPLEKVLGRIHRPHLRIPTRLKSKKFWLVTAATVLVLGVLVYVFLVRPALEVWAAVTDLKKEAQILSSAIEAQDVVAADRELVQVDGKLEVVRVRWDQLGFLGPIPWLGNYFNDGRHLILAGQRGTEAGRAITKALTPFADVLSLHGASTATAEQKLQLLLPVMPQIAPSTEEISAKLKLVKEEIDMVDPDRYPAEFLSVKPHQALKDIRSTVDEIDAFMPEAKEVLLTLPIALGSPTPKTYFVLFQNDKELRPTGGFLTAYTYLTISNGKITTSGSEDITTIDNTMQRRFAAPLPILKYLPLVPYWYSRDANLSPDFLVSMRKFDELAGTSPAYKANDGIIAVDTYLLRSLLKLTGSVKVVGDTFTADNVVEKIETYAEKVFSGENRKAFLGELMKEVLHRLITSGKDKWQPTITTALQNGTEKHFLVYSRDNRVQTLVEKYNWGGRIKDYKGDYLHINDTNFAGAKANLYVKEKITQNITIDSSGAVTKKVTVTVTNPVKTDGWLNGPYRDWVRMYVPKGSELVLSEGAEAKTSTTADELGKEMFESFFIARPLGYSSSNQATWSITYRLPFKITSREYKLLQQKQPGVDGPDLTISINGTVKVQEQLRSDKEFTLTF